jgi:hypothetical protein
MSGKFTDVLVSEVLSMKVEWRPIEKECRGKGRSVDQSAISTTWKSPLGRKNGRHLSHTSSDTVTFERPFGSQRKVYRALLRALVHDPSHDLCHEDVRACDQLTTDDLPSNGLLPKLP